MSIYCCCYADATASAVVPLETKVPVPYYGSCFFKMFHKVHSFWRCCQRTSDITYNASQFGMFMGGCLLNICCGNNPCVQVSARTVMVARRLLDCVKEHVKFFKSCGKLGEAWCGANPDPTPRVQFSKDSCWSPSTRRCFSQFLNKVIDFIVKIAKAIFNFFLHAFRLSMRYMDLVDAFSEKPGQNEEAIQDFFLNCNEVLRELNKHEAEVHHVLAEIGARYDIQPLTGSISGAACIASTIYGTVSYAASKCVEFCSWTFQGQPTTTKKEQDYSHLAFKIKYQIKEPFHLLDHSFRVVQVPQEV